MIEDDHHEAHDYLLIFDTMAGGSSSNHLRRRVAKQEDPED